jgi:hypothetical protein
MSTNFYPQTFTDGRVITLSDLNLTCCHPYQKPQDNQQKLRKGFDTLVVLVWWLSWKKRNTIVFNAGHSAKLPA